MNENALVAIEPSVNIIEAATRLPPRDMVKVQAGIREVACRADMCRRAIYFKPVGKKKIALPGGGEAYRQQFAIGPSIRLAEIAHQNFGKLWVRSATIDEKPCRGQDPGSVTTMTAVFDLESLNIVQAEDTSPVYKETLRETARDRSFSLGRRDALLQLVRPQCEAVMGDVKKQIIRSWAPEGTDEKERLAAAFTELKRLFLEGYGISEQQLRSVVAGEEGTIDGVYMLTGILNWLQDGNKAEDVFGPVTPGSKPEVTLPRARAAAPQPQAAKGGRKPADQKPGEEKPPAGDPTFAEIARAKALAAGLTTDEKIREAMVAELDLDLPLDQVPADKMGDVLAMFEALANQQTPGA